MTDDLLEQAITALKEGRKAAARRLLKLVLEQDQRNEMAWLWLSGVVDSDAERRICLENVLAINPNNGIAQRGLERLGTTQSVSPFTTVDLRTPGRESIQPLVQTSAPGETDAAGGIEHQERGEREGKGHKPPPPRRATGIRSGPVLGWVAALVVACIAIAGAWWAVASGRLRPEPVPTRIATVDIRQTPTFSPMPPPTWTPRPTGAPPTAAPTQTARPTKTPFVTWTPSLTPTATLTGTFAPSPTPAIKLPPTWTPHPTSTPAPGITMPPTWTPQPTNTPGSGITLPPTWTPYPTITPAPGIPLPPTWTPYPTRTPAVTPTPTLTATSAPATPGG
jgi:hypothetical protein